MDVVFSAAKGSDFFLPIINSDLLLSLSLSYPEPIKCTFIDSDMHLSRK